MSKIVFLDTETTSLRHDRRVWDVGLIVRQENLTEIEWSWFLDAKELDLGNADLGSLKIGRFYERHPQYRADLEVVEEEMDDPVFEQAVMSRVEVATRGATIVGAVPWFDTDVLGQRMRANGLCPSWHYHLVDVETLAAGALRLSPPWDFDVLLAKFDLTYDEADRHTAIGDARMVRDLYDAVMAQVDIAEPEASE